MSPDTIVYAGLGLLGLGLATLAAWHMAKRNPLIFFATDALYLMAVVEVLVPVARMTLAA